MPTKLNLIGSLLHLRPSLQHLLAEIRHQEQLLRLVQQNLPHKIGLHCYAATMQDARLCLSVDSPVWASQLRFAAPELLSKLRRTMPGIANIKIRTAPIMTQRLSRQRKIVRRHCSEDSIRQVQMCAEYTNEAKLGAALHRLARSMQKIVQ